MRRRFSDEANVRALAEHQAKTGLTRLRRWWSTKYKLPPSHTLFTSQALPEVLLEYFEDLYVLKAELEAALDAAGDEKEARSINDRLKLVCKALGVGAGSSQDDLVDHWEAEIEAGRVPNLDLMPGDLP